MTLREDLRYTLSWCSAICLSRWYWVTDHNRRGLGEGFLTVAREPMQKNLCHKASRLSSATSQNIGQVGKNKVSAQFVRFRDSTWQEKILLSTLKDH